MTNKSLVLLILCLTIFPQVSPCGDREYGWWIFCWSCDYTCFNCDGGGNNQCNQCVSTRYLSGGYCPCRDGYYNYGGYECGNCDNDCQTCYGGGSNQCTSCNSGDYRYQSGNSCPCYNGYYNSGGATCSSCHYKCTTCVSSSTNCQSCGPNRGSAPSCSCSVRFYDSGAQACSSCHYSCYTCSSSSSSSCTSCLSSDYRTLSSSTCLCNTGYYDSGSQICSTCNYKCVTCSTSSSNCLTCGANRGSAPSCSCSVRFYDSGAQACTACHYSCKTCSGTSSTNCLTCQSTDYRTISSTSCPCNALYYDSGVQTCSICNYKCLTCVNSATNCLTCGANRQTAPACINQIKFYDNGVATCPPCNYTCAECTSSATNCISCNATSFRVLSGSQCKCMDRYFDQSIELCSSCLYKCATCVTTSTNCLTCGPNRLTATACLCQIRFYDDGSSNACLACHYSCASCVNPNACTTCDSTKFRVASSLSNYCLCQTRYYDGGSSETCLSCHSTCLTCSNSANTNCLGCNKLSFRELSSGKCVCAKGYYETSNTLELCSKCDTRCDSCVGTQANCTSCNSLAFRTGPVSNTCNCLAGYYEDSFITCQLCHYTCLTCNDGFTCASCSSASKRQLSLTTGLCVCNNLYYDVGVINCVGCSYTCATCLDSSTKCLACPTSSKRTLTNNLCPCDPLYYDDGNITCKSCHYSCSSCVAYPSCKTCNTGKRRTLSSNSCICIDKYYDNGLVEDCQPCLLQCKTCTNGTKCTSCDSSLFRQLSGSLCPCIQHYYLNGVVCSPCLYQCSTCFQSTTCLTCNVTNFRTIDTATDICQCMEQYYDAGNNTQRCLPCSYTCLTCLNANTCATCNSNNLRTLKASQCVCKDGYYETAVGVALCVVCPFDCETCSASGCLTCETAKNRILNSTSGRCLCNTGYYSDGINEQCIKCHYSCYKCSNYSVCTECNTTLRTFSSSSCICSQRLYDNLQNVTCSACHYSCSTCIQSTSCSSCNATRFRKTSTSNYCECMTKYYNSGTSQICVACKYSCETCTNGTVCLTCNQTKFRQTPASSCVCMKRYYNSGTNEQCLACQYTCLTCTNGTQCASCDSTNFRVINTTTKLCQCMDRYVDTGNNLEKCVPCIYRCQKCTTSAQTCTSCNSTALRTLSSSQCPCNQYYYDDGENQECVRCGYNCSTCSNGVSCDTCNISRFRIHNVTTDLCDCIVGYFDNNSTETCTKCNLTCLACVNSSACISCQSSRNRILNSTKSFWNITSYHCVCPYRYYDLGESLKCQKCHYSCEVCTGPQRGNCSYCSPQTSKHRYLNTTSKQCLCEADNYFDDGINQQCQSCDFKCIRCYERYQNNCTKCQSPFYFVSQENKCYVTCPSYYYNNVVGSIKTCTACSKFCITCVNPRICKECQVGKYKFVNATDFYCTQNCPSTTYANSNLKQCVFCSSGCKECTVSTICQKCRSSYYLDSIDKSCKKCHSTCQECTGPNQNQCVSCVAPLFFQNSQCFVKTCLYNQFVENTKGCQSCSAYFSNSITCNRTSARSCQANFHLSNGKCVNCLAIVGYSWVTLPNGDQVCREICGDGIKINAQCDDGNNLNGDGCSSLCTIEEGWICNGPCILLQPISFKLSSIMKYGGQNKVKLRLKLSLPVRLNKQFDVAVQNIAASMITWSLIQNAKNLSNIQLQISFKADIQNKKIAISYKNSRRLFELVQQGNNVEEQHIQQKGIIPFTTISASRSLQTISLEAQFTLVSYPPSFFYTDNKINFYRSAKQLLFIFSLVLLLLCAILIPKKVHLHAVTLSSLPSLVFIAAGLLLQTKSDWIKSTVSGIQTMSLIGGISFGQCCHRSQFFQYPTQISKASGFVIIAVASLWLIYLFLSFLQSQFACFKKLFIYSRYYLITIQLLVCCHLSYSSFRVLSEERINGLVDAANISISLFVAIYSLFMIGLLWSFTKQLKIQYENPQDLKSQVTYHESDVEKNIFSKNNSLEELTFTNRFSSGTIFPLDSSNNNSIVRLNDTSRILSSQNTERKVQRQIERKEDRKAKKKQQNIKVHKEEPQLAFDYHSLYQKQNTASKYFLPFFFTKMLFFSIVSGLLHSYPFYVYMILFVGQIIFISYLFKVKPFISKFTNFRIITIQIALSLLYGISCYFIVLANSGHYIENIQYSVIVGCITILGLGSLFMFIEHLFAWSEQIWSKLEICLVNLRLRRTAKVHNDKNREVEKIQVEEMKEKVEEEGDNRFYDRIMKGSKKNSKIIEKNDKERKGAKQLATLAYLK